METINLDLGEVELEIDDAPRELMLDTLQDELSEERVNELIQNSISENLEDTLPVEEIITSLYDQKQQLVQMEEMNQLDDINQS